MTGTDERHVYRRAALQRKIGQTLKRLPKRYQPEARSPRARFAKASLSDQAGDPERCVQFTAVHSSEALVARAPCPSLIELAGLRMATQ